MENSYRIHTQVAQDTVLNVNMTQDMDFLEILSLKLSQSDAYKLFSSNYGVIVGRVLANDAFGIPNAKISMFIERDSNDSVDIENIYPYTEVSSNDSKGRRYNLLPDYSDDDCYRVVGTFPQKRLVLDDDTYLEIYDKYWKYSTVTNNAGDYMLFGVPSGNQQIHIDMDLSDIGILSQKPRDFEYKGYNLTLFDNANQFKESTNLDGLAQIFSQNQSVFVYPFWGDADNGIAAITRSDVQIQYKFEPTCVFMGCIVSDNEGHAIGHRCSPSEDSGLNTQLVAGNGTIEMIRKTTDGLVEEFQIQGNQLIDEDGVWCYQIPMNLDYIGTDEYGNIAPTDNPNKGIPTRAQVRFRFSKTEMGDEGFSRHTAKYLVPQNPIFSEDSVIPKIQMSGAEVEKMYNFGSATPEWCFRDLYWNNVYSVKNYIPRVQTASRQASHNYTALKGSNLAEDQNPIPFNKLRIDMPFMYMLICIIFEIIVGIMCVVNGIITIVNIVLSIFWRLSDLLCLPWPISWCPIRTLVGWLIPEYIPCLSIQPGMTEGNVVYFPCCSGEGMKVGKCDDEGNTDCPKSSGNIDDLIDKIQRNLAVENKIVKLDLYQDWINGCLYMPLWYWRKRKKKSFLFGLFTSRAKSEYCSCERKYDGLRLNSLCDLEYTGLSMEMSNSGYKRWQSYKAGKQFFKRGLIKPYENKDGLTAYYYAATQATTKNNNPSQALADRPAGFYAVRLFATDIILLGNLDANNLYGIPQFFKCLPSTTANMPPMATTVEEPSDENADEEESEYEFADGGVANSGTTMTTGMDWWNNGEDSTPQYKRGLFMDLACTVAYTRQKSCINAERLSELGVNLDTTYLTDYKSGGAIQSGPVEADGFISKWELEDNENRAMFATLNHIGFIPQTYQESHDLYETQVMDSNTGYFINKFKYIYPVDFDGRAQAPMNAYKKKFQQAMADSRDESYLTFRLGAEKNPTADANNEHRVRHFYFESPHKMPLYNNSYYFYFGVNKGSTAIDKFNEMFSAECFQNTKNPFTLDLETQGVPYCPNIYTDKNKAYGYIKVVVDDIRSPYSYTLYNSLGNEIISESGLTMPYFVIGGKTDGAEGDVVCNEDGVIKYQFNSTNLLVDDKPVRLENQQYILEVIDSDGKVMSERIDLQISLINTTYQTLPLGTEFYNTESTPLEYICDDIKEFYGLITMSGFSVDGYDCALTNVEFKHEESTDEKYVFLLQGTPVDTSGSPLDTSGNSIYAYLELKATVENAKDCLCDGTTLNPTRPEREDFFWYFNNDDESIDYHVLTLYVYQPQTFIMTITQGCKNGSAIDKITENASSSMVTVDNGESFSTFLNEMPTRFILPSHQLYNPNGASTNVADDAIVGWFNVHKEETYSFIAVSDTNESLWSDMVDLEESIAEESSKWAILQKKFQWIFNISESVFVTELTNGEFEFTAEGGVQPILYRRFAPYIEDETKMLTYCLFSDDNQAEGLPSFPMVVGSNYVGPRSGTTNVDADKITRFNESYLGSNNRGPWTQVGNYFAAFTNNGGYSGQTGVDPNAFVLSSPEGVDVRSNKPLGQDIEVPNRAYGSYSTIFNGDDSGKTPYLRAITVDRRLDYELVIFPPYTPSVDLYNDNSFHVYSVGRISGFTYNGIEMSYDENHNIISEPHGIRQLRDSGYTDETLEYSYDINDNAKVIYNEHPTIPRKYYNVTFCDMDLTNSVWSDTTRDDIYGNLGATSPLDGEVYLFKYPYNHTELYNGDFSYSGNEQTDNYPTKRYIDITNIDSSFYTYNLQISSCGYNINPNRVTADVSATTVNYITGTTNQLRDLSTEIELDSTINVVQTDNMKDTDGHLKYKRTSQTVNGRYVFKLDDIQLSFTVDNSGVENHDTYVKVPRLVNLFPFEGANSTMDAISYLKSANIANEYPSSYANGKTLDEAITDIGGDQISSRNIQLPSGYKVKSGFDLAPNVNSKETFIQNNGKWTKADEISEVIFKLKGKPNDLLDIKYGAYEKIGGLKLGTVLLDKICIAKDSTLTQTIRLVQPTLVLDTRDIYVQIVSEGTYITKHSDEEGNSYYTQTITFDIGGYDDTVPNIQDRTCQTVTDTSTSSEMSYQNNTYQVAFVAKNTYIVDAVVSVVGGNVLRLTCNWAEDQGYLGDGDWLVSGLFPRCSCIILITTPDGTIYRLGSILTYDKKPSLPSNDNESKTINVRFN